MGLVLKESIHLTSLHGESEVQLLFGDITQLSPDDKVDFIFVSAFPGDYAAVPGTLIGALSRTLGLSVRTLAQNKDVDLRVNFNCWVSKPLPAEMSFSRLVCFERMNRSERLPNQISSIFRAMMPIFNDKETTVITPLLAAGNQGHSEGMVLQSIVTASCKWIKAGLPLKRLKIVVYTNNPHALSPGNDDLLQTFSKLKKKWETLNKEMPKHEEKYDICISFCEEDSSLAEKIKAGLQKVDSRIVVFSEYLIYDQGQVFQEKMFSTMISSRRVVAVLTPHYIAHPECLEQYNIALCCNRLTGRDVLTPFYMKTIDVLPSYMTLVQYTECRVRREGEVAEELIISACSSLIKHLNADMQIKSTKSEMTSPDQASNKYDVFISYAHKNSEKAHDFHTALLDANPDMKIFFDTSELRAGKIWQETLYEAVDQAKCVVALLSSPYFQSTVCQEEYNIALARFLSKDGIILVAVLAADDVQEVPACFSGAPVLDMRRATRGDELLLARNIDSWLYDGGKPGYMLSHPTHPLAFRNILETWRVKDFNARFIVSDGNIRHKMSQAQPAGAKSRDPQQAKRVVLSCAQDCFKYAAILSKMLALEISVNIGCEFLTTQEVPKVLNMQAVDSADMVVIFVSDDYIASMQHRHVLHAALCRQRTMKDKRVLYLIQANHTKSLPVYAHILPHSISMGDVMWMRMGKKVSEVTHKILVNLSEGQSTFFCNVQEKMALDAAAVDIVEQLCVSSKGTGSGMPTNIVNLLQLRQQADGRFVPLEQCLIHLDAVSQKVQAHNIELACPSSPPDMDLAEDTSLRPPESQKDISFTRSADEAKENISPTKSADTAKENVSSNNLGGDTKRKIAKKSTSCTLL